VSRAEGRQTATNNYPWLRLKISALIVLTISS
jgi:hypothetical protein